ncbi:MAG: DNA polymerase III subunit beta [Armatimonadetes bacterium]|nr:DNA polymerase III subunit beta [Armatimonadota bacterium]
MKFTCPRKEFVEAVQLATTASANRSPNAILQNLKLAAGDSTVRILGCDGEIWVERTVSAFVEETGAVCLQATLLKDWVSSLIDGDIELKTQDQGVQLTHSSSEFKMRMLDADDFPEPPDYGGEGELTLTFGDLKEAIDAVIYAVSPESHRAVLNGVLFNYDGTVLTMVATDTHRLAVRRIKKEGIGSNINAVVPAKALRALKTMPLADDAELVLRFGVGRMGVDTGNCRMVAQLLMGTFPNWERVVPSESTREWSMEVDQLFQKVRRALILAKDNNDRLEFKGTNDRVTIIAQSEGRGLAKEEVEMHSNNGDINIAFNGKYVNDLLQVLDGPGIRVQMTENNRPAVFRPADDDQSFFCVIMPMALT